MARPLPPFKVYPLYFLLWMCSTSASLADINSCSAVKSEYLRQGFRDTVPDFPIPGRHLKICSSEGSTCCTSGMERNLGVQSRQDFDVDLKDLLNPFANLLDKKHKKFDELFTQLLNQSQLSFDVMFTETYGVIYKQNSYFFMDLFQSLKDYYYKGEKDMQSEMDKFFRKLYEKMFTVYNSQYLFNDNYLTCVHNQMDKLKPFGDDPAKLTTNMKRSFVAFRTFVQGIDVAASVVRNVPLKVNPSVECLHELMKMSHCASCAGYQATKPCLPYCLHVQELCLARHLPLAQMWTEYVGAMEKLGDRLEGPFNIGHEVQPINLKISNAVMNFQESGTVITDQIMKSCGKPNLKTRQKRNAARGGGELNYETLDFRKKKNRVDDGRLQGEAITRLIREIKTKIKNSQSFWSELPTEMCKEARHHGAANCWTGNGLGKYSGDSLLNLSQSSHSSQMEKQIFRLKVITNKLIEAYNGRDVSWVDDEWLKESKVEPLDDQGYDGSGDGGSGWDGRHTPDNDGNRRPSQYYPPDDEDGYDISYGEGSGYGGNRRPDPYDNEMEGSGDRQGTVRDSTRKQNPRRKGNPSASPAEKPMTLTWAVAVYMLPAVLSFLGSIG